MENMKRKRQVNATTIQRYYEGLKKLEELTKDKFVKLKLQEFISDCGINNRIGAVLISKGILKRARSTENSRIIAYKWNTIKPSLQMAKAVIEENRRIESERGQSMPREFRLKNKTAQINILNQKKDPVEKEFIQPFFEGNRIEQKQTRKRKEIKTEKQKEISLFWGLVKIQIK